MAEVLGIVTGSLTLVEVLGKTISGIEKLYHLSCSIRDVPTKISEAVTELHLLVLVLKRLENNPSFEKDNDAAKYALLQHCNRLVNSLDVIFTKLQGGLGHKKQRKRHWAAFQGYLHKENVDEIYSKLNRATNLLNLIVSEHIL